MTRLTNPILLLLIYSFLFIACVEEENISNEGELSILGEWKFTDSDVEIISVTQGTITINPPNVVGNKWVFLTMIVSSLQVLTPLSCHGIIMMN